MKDSMPQIDIRHMNIMCSCDANYVPCCGIMLTSLFENNRDYSIDVYVFCNNNDTDTIQLFQLAKNYGQKIHIINIDDVLVDRFPIKDTDHITKATYYRLYAADFLPNNIDRVLYLDCDIIINKSLSMLYDIDLTDYSAAVVLDCNYYQEDRNRKLGIAKPYIYFNAGVLLINLTYWRTNRILNKFIQYSNTHSHLLDTHDQDLLNVVLQGNVKYLSIEYNYQTGFLLKKNLSKYDEWLRVEIKNIPVENIIVWHFSTAVKPWNCWYFAYPHKKVWNKYKNMSLWKDWKFEQPILLRLHCCMLYLLYTIGLKSKEFE